jgi:SNF2 family DNA or RNA helicase
LQHLVARGVGGVLADDMGLGKTLQTIAHICIEKASGRLDKPALVVAPTSLAWAWAREIERFAPHLSVLVLQGPGRRAKRAKIASSDVVVTTYPLLVRDDDLLDGHAFHLCVLDEAQAIKNARSQVHRAIKAVRADNVVCLTGTPVENHLGELWALFDVLNPGLLGDELAFLRAYKKPIETLRDEERLGALKEIVAPFILRRVKRDVAKELPPKTELYRGVELSGKQRELYEAIRVAAHADVRKVIRAKGLAASTIPILDALMKLRQVCCDPRLVAMDEAKKVKESAKYEALFDLVTSELEGGHKILIFSQFTSMLALVAEGLRAKSVRYSVLTGATRERQKVVDAFERGESEVFLISLKAGGTGLNLVSADTVVHYDPWWNPAAQAQATDRAYRIGQTRPVFVHNLFVAGSVEERVVQLQKKKRWLSATLLGDEAPSGHFTENDVEELFAPLE